MEKKLSRIQSFDFIRGVAILGVIAVHVSQSFNTQIFYLDSTLSLGRFGIQLFFFVSAMTMCYMWDAREGETSPTFKFYIRRFFRIAPLFWLAILVYICLYNNDVGVIDFLTTFLFVNSFSPDSINSIVPGGWSISVEMIFYLLFPLLIIYIRNRSYLYLILAVSIYFVHSIPINYFLEYLNSNFLFLTQEKLKEFSFMTFTSQLPIFLLGCFLYFECIKNSQLKFRSIFLVFIAWFLSAIFILKTLEMPIKNINFLIVIFAEFSFIYFILKLNPRFQSLEKIGENTYGIYLSHFGFISAMSWFSNFAKFNINPVIEFLFVFFCVLLVSYYFSLVLQNLIDQLIKPITTKIINLL